MGSREREIQKNLHFSNELLVFRNHTDSFVDAVLVVVESDVAIADHRADLGKFVVVVPVVGESVEENAQA